LCAKQAIPPFTAGSPCFTDPFAEKKLTDNKRIRNSELAAWVTAAESSIHGKGVFANRRIRKGEYIGTYWGPQATRNGTYVLWVYEHAGEDSPATGRSGRNLLRYLNHAAPGNTEFEGFDLYARVTIQPGEELTFDYQESEFD
jgi:SET domain-containing protein